MARQIERMEAAVHGDPTLAIGTAKELMETCCKTILKQRDVTYSRGADLGTLTKALVTELELVPEGVHEAKRGAESIKQILRNLTAMTNHLAELRGLYGTGHGQDGQHRGLQPRHARLAVGAAATFVDFVTETHSLRPLTASTKDADLASPSKAISPAKRHK
jgi:hypothetical protein